MERTFTQVEREHYEKKALDSHGKQRRSLEEGPFRAAYREWFQQIQALPPDRPLRVLDYCTGLGHHAVTIQRCLPLAEVEAIDVCEGALEKARAYAQKNLTGRRPVFRVMDAHALTYPDATFDLVSDFGSLSSLDFDSAIGQVWRVLKPGGVFIALETFGHNPVTNLKRQVNVWLGKRTQWAAAHILTREKLERLSQQFYQPKAAFFGFTTLGYGLVPWDSARLLGWMERLDERLLSRFPKLCDYAFKVLFVGEKR